MTRVVKYLYAENSHQALLFKYCKNCGTKTLMTKEGIFCSISCSKQGKNAPWFKGKDTVLSNMSLKDYKKYHARVYRAKGYAKKCINGCVAKKYNWANLTGKYENLDDYVEMCYPCHRKYDKDRKWEEDA